MYLHKIPGLVQHYYKRYRWRFETEEPVLYLTFDDGPTPDITSWVLDQLEVFNAKATFFLVGNRVQKYPSIVHDTIDQGHTIGNHTHNHRDGWKTGIRSYLREFILCQQAIFEYTGIQAGLFRPPYGRLTHTKAKYIARTHEIIMMDVLAGDWDDTQTVESCFSHILDHARPGSIILLHDSQKAWPRLEKLLPRVLAHYKQLGYRFEAIPTHSPALLPAPII